MHWLELLESALCDSIYIIYYASTHCRVLDKVNSVFVDGDSDGITSPIRSFAASLADKPGTISIGLNFRVHFFR